MFKIDFKKSSSFSEQIYNHIVSLISNEIIKSKYRLPSIRRMAKINYISRCHVERAYEYLSCDGYIESIPQKGFYVI